MDVEELGVHLRSLYASVRTKPKPGQTEGEVYSRSGYRNLRAGLQRHLVSPPFNRRISLMSDRQFMGANQVYEGMLKKIKKEGKDFTAHKKPIDPQDMEKLYSSGVLSNDTPEALQNKVFVELGLHFACRGREGWASLKKDSFEEKTDARGRQYVTITYNEYDKNHSQDEEKCQMMFATNDERCPVYSFNLYLNKLNPQCQSFLQRPSKRFIGKDIWYDAAPLGKNTICNMLKKISVQAECATVYTNHCLKASAATVLKKAGCQSQDIMSVTGHKNVASLQSYAAGPSGDERARMSGILSAYGANDDNDENQPLASHYYSHCDLYCSVDS